MSTKKKDVIICKRCVMDTTIPGIRFDNQGICNFCKEYEERIRNEIFKEPERSIKLEKLITQIKTEGKNKEYDCIIGVSGGVDSSFVAHLTKSFGLRPLAIHLDNGWNSNTAVENIRNLLNKLNIDLFTHVINWEEFKDLQKSFIYSSIENLEIPTDHAINALLLKSANKYGIKYVLNGSNLVTEGILPVKGGRNIDYRLIMDIHRKFGKIKLNTYPSISFSELAYLFLIKRIKFIPILNYIDYDKQKAIKILEKEYGWKKYEAKHFESIFTRFFQGYILPVKYKYDKRKAHFSTLIMSGQISREQALEELKKDPYPNKQLLKEDYEYFLKKFGFTDEEFKQILNTSPKKPTDYKTYEHVINILSPIIYKLKEYSKGN